MPDGSPYLLEMFKAPANKEKIEIIKRGQLVTMKIN